MNGGEDVGGLYEAAAVDDRAPQRRKRAAGLAAFAPPPVAPTVPGEGLRFRAERGVGWSGTSGLSERRHELAWRGAAGVSEGDVSRVTAPTVRGGVV